MGKAKKLPNESNDQLITSLIGLAAGLCILRDLVVHCSTMANQHLANLLGS